MKIRLSETQQRRSQAGGGFFIPLPRCKEAAFTLLEVMIATFLFFTAVFAILALCSQCLQSARILKQHGPSIGKVAGDVVLTNKLEEGYESGDFRDDGFRDYTWEREVKIYGTNGLFEVNIVVLHKQNIDSTVSFLLYRPDSQPSALNVGGARR